MAVSLESRINIEALKANLSGIHPVRGDAARAVAAITKGSGALAGKFGRQELERIGDRTVGSDVLVGGQPQTRGDATLGEIERRLEQSNIRFNLSTLFLTESSLKPLLKKMIKRNHQFLPDEKRVRIFTVSGQNLTSLLKRDDWMGNFDIKIKMAPLQGNKRTWSATLIEYLKVVTRDKGQHPALVARIGEALELEDVEELVRDPARAVLKFILKAQAEGQMQNPEQTALMVGEILRIIAPPGSENQKFANQFAQALGQQGQNESA